MPNQTGPRTERGKALTRYNAATHGIYSVTPVLPRVERQADWLAHRAEVFADLQPQGYIQEIIAERIALNSWRLRRLTRYEREQVRNRQRNIPTDLNIHAMYDGRKLEKEPLDEDLDLIDRWQMNGLIPDEKELMLLMRYEGRLSRELRRDMLHLEHMQRRQREERGSPRAAFAAIVGLSSTGPSPLPYADDLPAVEEGPSLRALAPAGAPESQPALGFAKRDENSPAARVANSRNR